MTDNGTGSHGVVVAGAESCNAHLNHKHKAESEQRCVCVLPPEGCTTETPKHTTSLEPSAKIQFVQSTRKIHKYVKKDVGKTMCVHMWHTGLIYHL